MRLMLVRHAKSKRPPDCGDHDRRLTRRGREASRRMGSHMAGEGLAPDLVVISTARRAQETWHQMRDAFDPRIAQQFQSRVYGASSDALVGIVRETPSDVRTLLMIGHNPGFQELALRLTGKAPKGDIDRLRHKLPTAGLVVIDFAAESWRDARDGQGKLSLFETPRTIG
jgi:phosphohistidine phosphatase